MDDEIGGWDIAPIHIAGGRTPDVELASDGAIGRDSLGKGIVAGNRVALRRGHRRADAEDGERRDKEQHQA